MFTLWRAALAWWVQLRELNIRCGGPNEMRGAFAPRIGAGAIGMDRIAFVSAMIASSARQRRQARPPVCVRLSGAGLETTISSATEDPARFGSNGNAAPTGTFG